jgi:prophage maintenance system killer protein
VGARVFLADNGCGLMFNQIEGYRSMKSIAEGTTVEAAVAGWFRECISPLASA